MLEPMPLLDIARLEEKRLVKVVSEICDEHRPFGGGVMGRATPGNFMNYAVGFGLDGPPAGGWRAEVESLIHWYEEKGIEPRMEVSPFVDEGLLAVLEELKFVVRLFEIVLYRQLTDGRVASPIF